MVSRKQPLLFAVVLDHNDLCGVDFIVIFLPLHLLPVPSPGSRGLLVFLFRHRTETSTSLSTCVLGHLAGHLVSHSSTTGFLLVKKDVSKIGILWNSSMIDTTVSTPGNTRLLRWQISYTFTMNLWITNSLSNFVYSIKKKKSNEIMVSLGRLFFTANPWY